MSTFIQRYRMSGSDIGMAVKDLIDLAGWPASAGCTVTVRPDATAQARLLAMLGREA